MKNIWRTIFVLLGGFIVWMFWFVPNSLFWFVDFHQLAIRTTGLMVFGIIPAAVGVLISILVASGFRHAIAAMVGIPTFSFLTCILLWSIGYYSDEGLMGAWLNSLPPMPAYLAGAAVGIWLRMRSNPRLEGDAPQAESLHARLTRTRYTT